MTARRSSALLTLARVWAYPLWVVAMRSKSRADIVADVNWWVECLKDDQLAALDTATRFAYFSGALPEFRTLVHYRLRGASPLPIRMLMRRLYKGQEGVIFEPDSLGPACFIQHGIATLVAAKSIGSHFYIHQQVTIGFTDETGPPTIGDHVTIGAGALVLGNLTIGDGAFIGAGALVLDDVGPGEVMVGPKAHVLKRLSPGAAGPSSAPPAEPGSPER
jgi:serine O-acetyltransferase